MPSLRSFDPLSTLELPEHRLRRSCVPSIDFHCHLGRWLTSDGSWMEADVGPLLERMDGCNVQAAVNLDGRWGDELSANLDRFDLAHEGRFATFCHVDWSLCAAGRFDALAASLDDSVRRGAKGLKVWKDLGKSVRDQRGKLVLPDDPRLGPLWETAARLGVPVLVHTGDPVAYFRPVDRHNERLEELRRYPGATWHRGGLPTHGALTSAFARLAGANPRTRFVGAHVAGWAENLDWVARLLAEHPNVSIDISARIADLGRQPRAAAELITRFADRVLFGSDVYPWRVDELEIYFRFLETSDEHFAYSVEQPPPFGRWRISGLGLDRDVLSAVYAGNAKRLLPSLA